MVCQERGALKALLVAVALLRLTVAAPKRQDGDCEMVPLRDFFLWADRWGPDGGNQQVSAEGDGDVEARIESGSKAQCDEDEIIKQLHRLQAITPESIVLLVTEEDLDELCNQVRDSLNAMAKVTSGCATLGDDDRDIYQGLMRGVAALHADLCTPETPGGLRANFLNHSACLRNLSLNLQECAGPRDWTDLEDARALCGVYQRIATCYQTTTAVACGSEAADLMHHLVDSVASSVLGNVSCNGTQKLGQAEQQGKPGQPGSFSSHHISFSIVVLTFCSATFALCG